MTFIEYLKYRLQEPLPGFEAHIKMAPSVDDKPFRNFTPSDNFKSSSVLVLLIDSVNPEVLLTLRSSIIKSHSGQISFPGGRAEKNETPIQTAIRETFEETGIIIKEKHIIGQLSKLFVPPSNNLIQPVIAYLDSKPELHINPDEVEETFYISLESISNDNLLKTEKKMLDKYLVDFPFWDVHSTTPLWGATAMILSELVDLYKSWKNNTINNIA